MCQRTSTLGGVTVAQKLKTNLSPNPMNNSEFVSFLFDKLIHHVDMDMLDLDDDDTAGIDALLFHQLELDLDED